MGKKTAFDSDTWQRAVIKNAREMGVDVTPDQARAMNIHADELIQWNRVSNLTAITEPLDMAIKHYVDSLAPARLIPENARVLDMGSGGGFPGVPLKIVRPDLIITLVDSVRKKTSFVNYAIGRLRLSDIHAVHARIENLADDPDFCGRFDLVISRAFTALATFAELSVPFLASGGSLLAMKGPQAEHDHEINDMRDDGTICFGDVRFKIRIQRYLLPMLGDQRRMVNLTPLSPYDAVSIHSLGGRS